MYAVAPTGSASIVIGFHNCRKSVHNAQREGKCICLVRSPTAPVISIAPENVRRAAAVSDSTSTASLTEGDFQAKIVPCECLHDFSSHTVRERKIFRAATYIFMCSPIVQQSFDFRQATRSRRKCAKRCAFRQHSQRPRLLTSLALPSPNVTGQ